MKTIRSDYLTNSEIREKAEEFREEYIGNYEIPVNILLIAEKQLDLKIVLEEGLGRRFDIDAYIAPNCEELWVDTTRYTKRTWEERLRFTFAHEIGHWYMHSQILEEIGWDTKEDWIETRCDQKNHNNISSFEIQSDEFAGRLLVPKQKLVEKIEEKQDKIDEFYDNASRPWIGFDDLKGYLASDICDDFKVTEKVVEKRIEKEDDIEDMLRQ